MSSYTVVWDGTPATGRQLFVPEEVRRAAPPMMRGLGVVKFRSTLGPRVLAQLERGDATTAGIAATLQESPTRVHKAVQSLVRRGVVSVVGVRWHADPFPGQHARVSVYGVRP